MTDYKAIGNLIREYRKKLKMTQKHLGQCIGVTESSIAKYEKGVTEIPLHKLAMLKMVLALPALPGVNHALLEESIVNIIIHSDFSNLANIQSSEVEENIYKYYSSVLESYNILLSKDIKGGYTLRYNAPGNSLNCENFHIASNKLRVIHQLFEIAKKEVGYTLFLNLKSNYKNLENIVDTKSNELQKPFINGKVIENINSANTDISPKHLAQKLNDPYTTHIQPFIQVIDDTDQNTKK